MVLRACYYLGTGDIPAAEAAGDAAGARAALEEARRLDALYPEGGDAAPPDISGPLAELDALISQAEG